MCRLLIHPHWSVSKPQFITAHCHLITITLNNPNDISVSKTFHKALDFTEHRRHDNLKIKLYSCKLSSVRPLIAIISTNRLKN